MSDEPDARAPIHQLNGRALLALKALIPEATWEEWIVNVIMLHRSVDAVETVTLETSATLYRGEEFFSRDDCRKRGHNKVRNLDGEVPINESYAGYCIQEGTIVWEDDLTLTQRPTSSASDARPLTMRRHPLEDKYRSFAYVGVKTDGPARSEYVFPIRLRIGVSGVLLGVLNCEWYGPKHESQNTFQILRRSRVAHLVMHMLDVHARFLPLAFDRVNAPAGDWLAFLEGYYKPCMDFHIARIRKGAPE